MLLPVCYKMEEMLSLLEIVIETIAPSSGCLWCCQDLFMNTMNHPLSPTSDENTFNNFEVLTASLLISEKYTDECIISVC